MDLEPDVVHDRRPGTGAAGLISFQSNDRPLRFTKIRMPRKQAYECSAALGAGSTNAQTIAILPRGGLGAVLYPALFARYLQRSFPDTRPILLAPQYAGFLAALLGVRHVPVCSVLTDASAGLRVRSEIAFFGALYRLRGTCLASFTNDVVDNGLARLFCLHSFDEGALGNSTLELNPLGGPLSRSSINRLLARPDDTRANPKHIIDRQSYALTQFGPQTADVPVSLPKAYRDNWLAATSDMGGAETDSQLILLFPETARIERNLTFGQIDSLVHELRSDYQIRIFTRDPELYKSLGIETAGFRDRLEPLRQIRRAAAVITADTFSAHLAGLCGTPTYVIYNFAYLPVWCEYWGAPFSNVFHFEGGKCYQLDDAFRAYRSCTDSPLFRCAQRASELTGTVDCQLPRSSVLSGSATRS
jgi:hypothetical protein